VQSSRPLEDHETPRTYKGEWEFLKHLGVGVDVDDITLDEGERSSTLEVSILDMFRIRGCTSTDDYEFHEGQVHELASLDDFFVVKETKLAKGTAIRPAFLVCQRYRNEAEALAAIAAYDASSATKAD
jgi:hypothetical protein